MLKFDRKPKITRKVQSGKAALMGGRAPEARASNNLPPLASAAIDRMCSMAPVPNQHGSSKRGPETGIGLAKARCAFCPAGCLEVGERQACLQA